MTNNAENVLKSLGINVDHSYAGDFAPLKGKRNYGQLLAESKVGLDQMETIAQSAPTAELKEFPQIQGLKVAEERRFVIVDGTVRAMVSDRFALHQHGDAVAPLKDALSNLGLTRAATSHEFSEGGARMTLHTLLPNLQEGAGINLRRDTGEDILLGLRLKNAHDGSGSLSLGLIGIRVVCTNWNSWGKDQYTVSVRHNRKDMAGAYTDAIKRIEADLVKLPDAIKYAQETKVAIKDVAPILIGAGLPPQYVVGGKRGQSATIPAISTQPWVYEPSIKENAKTASLWQVYNAGTALLTHAFPGTHASTENLLSRMGNLLAARSLDETIKVGEETLAKLKSVQGTLVTA